MKYNLIIFYILSSIFRKKKKKFFDIFEQTSGNILYFV